jgi:hypothetical protein
MATVVYTGLSEYAPRTAAAVNDILAAFVSQSTALTASNLRDEGLDERAIVAGAVAGDGDIVVYEGVDEIFSNTAYAVISYTTPSTTFRIDNAGTGWAIAAGGSLRIRFGIELSVVVPSVSPYRTATVSFIVVFRRGGVTTTVTLSEQEYQGSRFVTGLSPVDSFGAAVVQAAGTGELNVYRDAAQLTWWLQGNGNTIEWVEVRAAVTSGNYTLSKGALQGVAYYR